MENKKRIRPNLRMIGVDADTLARLKNAAGEKPLSVYLRELSYLLTSDTPPISDPVAIKLDEISKKFDLWQTFLNANKEYRDNITLPEKDNEPCYIDPVKARRKLKCIPTRD